MQHYLAADLGLHCLPLTLLRGPGKNGLQIKKRMNKQNSWRLDCSSKVTYDSPVKKVCLPNRISREKYVSDLATNNNNNNNRLYFQRVTHLAITNLP